MNKIFYKDLVLIDYIEFYDKIKESFIYSSMHVFQQDHRFKKIVSWNHQNISLFTTLLLLCGDTETWDLSKIDVLGLSETHIVDGDESDYAGLFKIDTLIKRNHSHGKGEGVAMYVENSIKFKQRQDL